MSDAVGFDSGVWWRSSAVGEMIGPACRVAMLLVLALALSDCGKKGPPEPPPGVPHVYPRTYPRE